ncbi:hypothetical protein [Pseudomonas sp. JG-B]|uniref:hypothetical protein n=1 Tax=Pseudomonas sp. JG-B TaxID=2603214 RepID=UPI00129E123B|nr:hypothetical protein [Pseudomonas sp. JG-B]MRK19115.1 hypothetical protein [Pseudomonas sp. JG-B]
MPATRPTPAKDAAKGREPKAKGKGKGKDKDTQGDGNQGSGNQQQSGSTSPQGGNSLEDEFAGLGGFGGDEQENSDGNMLADLQKTDDQSPANEPSDNQGQSNAQEPQTVPPALAPAAVLDNAIQQHHRVWRCAENGTGCDGQGHPRGLRQLAAFLLRGRRQRERVGPRSPERAP